MASTTAFQRQMERKRFRAAGLPVPVMKKPRKHREPQIDRTVSLAEHCNREVMWYLAHGRFGTKRLAKSSVGCTYVIGDWSWNRSSRDWPEFIEYSMSKGR